MEGFEEVLKVMSVRFFCFYFIRHPRDFGCLSLNVTVMSSIVFGMGEKIKLNKQPTPPPPMMKQVYFQPA